MVHPQRVVSGELATVVTEDLVTVMFETDRGAAGSVVLSQVSPGRKNRLWFSLDGTDEAYVFDQEKPDSLWVGGRHQNRIVPRGPDTLSGPAARYAVLPAGHPQGYQDCFNAFVGDCYGRILGGNPNGLPTFADGLRSSVLTAAVLESTRSRSWVEIGP